MQNLVIRENDCDLAWTQSNMASVTACVVDHFSELAIGNHRVMPARNTQRKGIGLIPALGKDWIDDVQGRILRVLRLAVFIKAGDMASRNGRAGRIRM